MKNMEKIKKYFLELKNVVDPKTLRILVSVIILTVLQSLLSPIKNILYSQAINDLSINRNIKFVVYVFAFYVIVQLIEECVSYLLIYLNKVMQLVLEQCISHKINQKMQKVKLICLETHEIHDLISRASQTVKAGLSTFLGLILSIYSPIATLILQSATLVLVAWYVPILILVFNIPYFFTVLANNQRSYDVEKQIIRDKRLAQYFTETLSDRNAAKDIRSYNLIDFLFSKLIASQTESVAKYKELLKQVSFYQVIAIGVQNLALILVLFLTGYLIVKGLTPIGSFVLVYNTGVNFQSAITNLINGISAWNRFGINFDDWSQLMALEEEKEGAEKQINKIETIKMENVEFHYPTSPNIIKKINLIINRKEKVAIIGKNGGGKTTLLYLLLGIYPPSAGRILINDVQIENCLSEYRNKTACLFQNFVRYQLPLKDNLSPNNLSTVENDSLIDFTKQFPDGISTPLGAMDEKGKELSGGQWKRIALYRTLHKKNIDLLVLDEPTANLDPEISRNIVNRLLSEETDKTVLIVTHDLEVASRFGRVIGINGGKIVYDDPPEGQNWENFKKSI